MRWIACGKRAGLVLAGLAGVSSAQQAVPYAALPGPVPQVAPANPYYGGMPYPYCPPAWPQGLMLPPGLMPIPTTPATPGTANTPTTPGTAPSTAPGVDTSGASLSQTGAMQNAAAAAAFADAQSNSGSGGGGERGSSGVSSAAPNMFGDAFNGNRLPIRVPIDRLALGVNSFASAFGELSLLSDQRIQGVSQRGFRVTAGARQASDFINPLRRFYTTPQPPLATALGQSGIQILGQYNTGSEFTGANPLLPTALNQVAPVVAPTAERLALLAPFFLGRNGVQTGSVVYRPEASGVFISQLNNPTLGDVFEVAYLADYVVEVNASPSAGGVVGRQKISEDTNPMPRDRIIFNYDYYSNVPLGLTSTGVSRFSPGIEKTFLDQRASLELRLPFAGTLDSDIQAAGVTEKTAVLGNLYMALKGLFYSDDVVHVSAGLGVAFPTSPDLFVRGYDNTPLVRLRNDSIVLTPYVAALITPTDKFFAQVWYSVAFDTAGSAVSVNPELTGLVPLGRFYEPALGSLDAQMAYWFYQSAGAWSWVRAVGMFAEMHWNLELNNATPLTFQSFQIGSTNKFSDLTLTAGVMTNIGDSLNISIGMATPLRNEPDRNFDYQIGIRANWFYGPTLGDRRAGMASALATAF